MGIILGGWGPILGGWVMPVLLPPPPPFQYHPLASQKEEEDGRGGWHTPPKEMKEYGPAFLSSMRGSRKRLGSYTSGLGYTLSSRWETVGETTRM